MNLFALFVGAIVGCEPTTHPPDKSTEKPPIAAPAPGIALELHDLQLFHPQSKTRALASASQEGKLSTVRPRTQYGVGFVINAINKTPLLLEEPDLLGTFAMEGAHGHVRCEIEPRRFGGRRGPNHLSADPTGRQPWQDESGRYHERAWRPGETIRMAVREDCADFTVLDTQLETITVRFTVTAAIRNRSRDPVTHFPLPDPDSSLVRSAEAVIVLPPEAAILQRATLPDGTEVHVAGDVVHRIVGATVERTDLATHRVRADVLKRTAVPDVFEPTVAQIGAVAFHVNGAQFAHWTDVEGVKKGNRQLAVPVQWIPTNGEPVERATCSRIWLSTTERELSPTNETDTSLACSQVTQESQTSHTLLYELNRYEVPIGLLLRTKQQTHLVPIAHQALLSVDPR